MLPGAQGLNDLRRQFSAPLSDPGGGRWPLTARRVRQPGQLDDRAGAFPRSRDHASARTRRRPLPHRPAVADGVMRPVGARRCGRSRPGRLGQQRHGDSAFARTHRHRSSTDDRSPPARVRLRADRRHEPGVRDLARPVGDEARRGDDGSLDAHVDAWRPPSGVGARGGPDGRVRATADRRDPFRAFPLEPSSPSISGSTRSTS